MKKGEFIVINTKNSESIVVSANNQGHAVALARAQMKWTANERDRDTGGWLYYDVLPEFELRISPIRIRGKS